MKFSIKHILCFAAFFLCLNLTAQNRIDRPKLVIGIVIDQMRWDYLYRFYDRYSQNGFKRLINKGFCCENTMLNYIPSYTAIGHASVYTGSVPSINGIAGNEFIDRKTGRKIYCTEDPDVKSLGIDNRKAGQMSPKNLKTTTITDELKLATNFRSKVVGISLKDRASILPAGHCADAAFWLDDATGKWITSSWYMQNLPDWLDSFNMSKPVQALLNQGWQTLYPIETYTQSISKNNGYEKFYTDEQSISFPINYNDLLKTENYSYGLIKETPSGNTLTKLMAEKVINNYHLGEDEITDFLAISFSATDYIGHLYSPNSIKIEDCYLRLDKDLADFLQFLDKKTGKNNYLVFLTADHGSGHNPQFLLDNKIDAGIWDYEKVCSNLNNFLKKEYGKDSIVKTLNNLQVNFDYSKITNDVEKEKIIKSCIQFFENQESTLYVVETSKAAEAAIPDVIKEKIINGYNRELCGEIQIILKPQYYSSNSMKGAMHEAWNPYDAHIPLIFYGKGIRHGSTTKETYITDIAATLAALLKIQMPSGCIGKPIF